MGRRILVAGAINTDLVANVDRAPEAGETITGRAFSIHSGGKGANQAVAASRSGADVVMLGGVGEDDFGRARIGDLRRDAIDTSHVATLERASSGVALITVEASGENRICYVPGATLEVAAQHCRETVVEVGPSLILAPNELSPEALRAVFGWGKDNGVPVVYNAAPFSGDAQALLPLVDVLVVNRGEAEALLGARRVGQEVEDLARGIVSLGVASVIVTLGGDGAIGLHEGSIFHEPAMKVDVVDTTGAGDTFCGAFAARLMEGASFREAVRYACVAGALSATRAGAQSSIPTRDEVEGAMVARS